MTEIVYPKNPATGLKGQDTLVLLAPRAAYGKPWWKKLLPKKLNDRIAPLVKTLNADSSTKTLTCHGGTSPARIQIIALSDSGSRHNTPTRKEEVVTATRGAKLGNGALILTCLDEKAHLAGVLTGVARAFPLFNMSTTRKKKKASRIGFLPTTRQGEVLTVDRRAMELCLSARTAARLVDTPTSVLNTAEFVREAKRLVRGLTHVTTQTIEGEALNKKGLRGIHAVGRAASVGPRLLILDYRPPGAKTTVALVGKGVVYDTGGLSLKPTPGMCTMKADMGGAAAVLGAFRVLAATKCRHRIIALTPLAENSVGPSSYRPDDILTLHSGHTVEINNTDAEGRLLLADAVSYAARTFKPDAVIDAATLTGAQLIATGDRHAAVMSNREGLEQHAFKVGKSTGDLCFPLPFAPEFFQPEFDSAVADMKNSVKNRMNAQASCASQFVYSHIDDLDLPWLHIDLAGPAFRGERATGFGVALISEIADTLTQAILKEK